MQNVHEMRFCIFNLVVKVLQFFAVNEEALATLKINDAFAKFMLK